MNIPHENDWNDYKLFNLNKDECVIYSLYDQEDNIIYIGRTQNFLHRMIAHKIEKRNIKKVRYFMTQQKISEEVEKQLIQLYKPKLNKSKKPKEKIFFIKEKQPEVTLTDIRCFFSENKVDMSFFSKKSGYTEKFLNGLISSKFELKKRTSENMRCLMQVYIKYWKNEVTEGKVKAEEILKEKEKS